MKAVKYVEMPETPQVHAVETSTTIFINLCSDAPTNAAPPQPRQG